MVFYNIHYRIKTYHFVMIETISLKRYRLIFNTFHIDIKAASDSIVKQY